MSTGHSLTAIPVPPDEACGITGAVLALAAVLVVAGLSIVELSGGVALWGNADAVGCAALVCSGGFWQQDSKRLAVR